MAEPSQTRARLDARFARTVEREMEGRQAGLRLPAALRESMVGAAMLDGGECPEALASYYTETMPRLLIDQMHRRDGAGHALFRRPIDGRRTPRLTAALDGLWAALASAELEPAALLGADSSVSLLAARPSVAALYERTLFGSGMPMVGAYPAERELLERELAEPANHGDADALLDLRLSGNLVHELCHGPGRERSSPPPPWMLLEAAALHLGACAFARHIFPAQPGEAVPGVSRFVLLGAGLACRFGRRALWRILFDGDALASAMGFEVAAALNVAGWQEWLRDRRPPFARDAHNADAWLKLADAALLPAATDGPTHELVEAVHRCASTDPLVVAARAPNLLAAAAALPWSALPWHHAPSSPLDDEMAEFAVRAMFQVNRLAPTFQTHPSDPPGRRLLLDTQACRLSAPPRPDGVFGEPARWVYPPPLCRRLRERGAHHVRIEGATLPHSSAIADALLHLAHGTSVLDGETVLSFD